MNADMASSTKLRIIVVGLCLTCLISTTAADGTVCIWHKDDDPGLNPCEEKEHWARDVKSKSTYCCASKNHRPVISTIMIAAGVQDMFCQCFAEIEFCIIYPLSCAIFK